MAKLGTHLHIVEKSNSQTGAGNGETLLTQKNGKGLGVIYYTPGASRTGVILQAGTENGQMVRVVNTAADAHSITFATAATSYVAGGTSVVISQNHSVLFVWSASLSRWVPTLGATVIGDGDVTTAKIDDEAVTLAKLDEDLAPSHVVKFADNYTTTGGNAAEAITVTGAEVTDIPLVTLQDDGTNNRTIVSAVITADTLTVTFSGDPGNDAIISYVILRATS